eukprot:evm.model.NODE_28744_length_10008_cov_18.952139.2
MRVLSMTALVAIAGSAVAFVPQAPKPSEKITIGKALQKLVLAPAVVLGIYAGPMIQPVHADGSVSATTVHRAGGIYGPRVMALKDAVAKGDFDAMKKEDGAATLYNSGAFALNRVQQKVVMKAYNDVRAAVAKKDAGALKSAWAVYFHEAGLDKPNPFKLDEPGQSYSGDFDFRKGSPLFDRYAAELAESGKK